MYEGKIPFNDKGQMHYPEIWHGEIKWLDNYKFKGLIKLIGMERGRSAAYFIVEDSNGKQYTMFCTDILGMLLMKEIKFDGIFEFCKRGMNYGVKLSNG